jgi:hypothetical protein
MCRAPLVPQYELAHWMPQTFSSLAAPTWGGEFAESGAGVKNQLKTVRDHQI